MANPLRELDQPFPVFTRYWTARGRELASRALEVRGLGSLLGVCRSKLAPS